MSWAARRCRADQDHGAEVPANAGATVSAGHRLTAMVTATAATTGQHRRSVAAHNARTIYANSGNARTIVRVLH